MSGPAEALTTETLDEGIEVVPGHDQTMGTLGRGTAALAVSTAAFIFLGFLARVTITHVVSVSQWGAFSLGLALSSLLAIVVTLGLPTAVSRALSYEPDVAARRRIVRTTLIVSAASAVAGSVVVFLAAPVIAGAFHNSGLTIVFQLFAPAIGFTVISTVLAAYFQGVEKVAPNAIFNMALNPALFLAFLGVALAVHGGFFGILVAYAVSAGVACAAIALYTQAKLPKALAEHTHASEADPTGHVSLLSMSVALFGAGSLNLLTQFADTLILALYTTTAIVGLYAAGMTLARLFLAGASALLYIYLPVSTRLRRTRDFDGLRKSYVTSARWVTVLTLPVFCVFFFDPGPTLGFVFGATYGQGILALRILTLASFLSVIIGPANAGLSGLGHPLANMTSAGSSLIVNVVLSFALIPGWGLIGAAVAWSVARLVYTCLCLAYIWKVYRVSPFASQFVRPLLLAMAVLVPIFLLVVVPGHSYVLLLGLVVLAYLVTLIAIPLTRSVERADLVLFDATRRRLEAKYAPALARVEAALTATESG
ncbi:MAG: flippase [Candidatus Lutacidiplasmatales archaeon]